jgi:hypothetical protein
MGLDINDKTPFDWDAWRKERIELATHPVRHIPKFGGMGISLCGILSHTRDPDKPLCEECAAARKRGEK